MPSLFLNRQSAEERTTLLQDLHQRQTGNCFICCQPIDLVLHKSAIEVDHVIPLSLNGPDHPSNFALTHDSCNRGKQDSDPRVARIIARSDAINDKISEEGRAANLGDVLEARRAATTALTLEEKLAGQKRIKALESQRNEKRRSLFDAQDKVDQQRAELIANIEGKLTQNASTSPLFTLRWTLRS